MNRVRLAAYAAAALPVFAIALLAWRWPDLRARAEAGSAYGARIGCSCRYVEGRSLASCEQDREPGMEMVRIDDDPAQRAVTASVPLMARRTARLNDGFGCLLDPAQ